MAFTIELMTDVAAQRHRVKTVAPIDSMATVNAYLDSLLSYRQKQMSEETTETYLDGRYYRLFAPLTFYHSPAGRALALSADSLGEDEVTGEVDAALLALYLRRPDLVKSTETKLDKTGSVRDDCEKHIKKDVELSQVAERVPHATVYGPYAGGYVKGCRACA